MLKALCKECFGDYMFSESGFCDTCKNTGLELETGKDFSEAKEEVTIKKGDVQ